jgi:hypothetical protein
MCAYSISLCDCCQRYAYCVCILLLRSDIIEYNGSISCNNLIIDIDKKMILPLSFFKES